MRSVGRLKGINFKLALAVAGLALTAAPVLAGQRPSEGAPSHGTAVERPSGSGLELTEESLDTGQAVGDRLVAEKRVVVPKRVDVDRTSLDESGAPLPPTTP